MELDCNSAKETVEDLKNKLRKAQCDITTLRAEHIAAPGLLECMTSDVASLRKQDEDLQTHLQRTNDNLAAVCLTTEAITTLVEELRTQNAAARQYTYALRPSFASNTSVDRPDSQDSVCTSHSQSFAEPQPELPRPKVQFVAY